MHVKAINGEVVQFPYRMRDLLTENPTTSFPQGYEQLDELLAEFDVYPVTQADQPAFDARTQTIAQDTQPELVDGVWILGWTVTDILEEVIAAQEQQTVDFVRSERDRFLRETDWMALSDQTLTPEWAAYRQALRELPQQEGFPHDIKWPTEPQ